MNITYSSGSLRTEPFPKDADLLRVIGHADVLSDMVTSIELAGVAEDLDFDDLAVTVLVPEENLCELILDRATFVLWFQFEVLNYLYVEGEPYAL